MTTGTHTTDNPAQQKRWAATTSVLAAVLLTGTKLAVALLTGSLGILSEALHSGVDLAGTVLSYAAVRVSDRPPDATHPYGHAKFESVAAMVAVGLLGYTAFQILREAAVRVLDPATHATPVPGVIGFLVLLLSIGVDFSRSRYLRRVAEEHGSQALAADATHFATDLYGSIAVLCGLVIVTVGGALGWPRGVLLAADAGAGAIVAVIILVLAGQLALRAVNSLTDRVPPDLVNRVTKSVQAVEHTIGEPSARVRFVGDRAYADVTVGVPRGLSLERTDMIGRRVVERVRDVLPMADVVVHTSPQAAETESEVDAAVIVAARLGLGVHHVRAFQTPEGIKLDMHMEVPSKMSLQAAHEQADHLEHALRAELPSIHAVEVHIEPRHSEFHTLERTVDTPIRHQIMQVAEQEGAVGVHDVQVLKGANGYVVSLHYYLPAGMPVSEAHALTAEIERRIRDNVQGIYRVTVHPEPVPDAALDGQGARRGATPGS